MTAIKRRQFRDALDDKFHREIPRAAAQGGFWTTSLGSTNTGKRNMGLYVHSLTRLPLGMERDYYVYVLDYGWDEPLTQALHANFRKMADLAAKSDAIVVAGTDSRAFAQEVLSVHVDEPNFRWDNINGEPGEDILPALMITTAHPRKFLDRFPGYIPSLSSRGAADDTMIIISIKGLCKTAGDVTTLIEKVFRDIAEDRPLKNFVVAKEVAVNTRQSVSEAFILKPAIYGIGVDIKALIKGLRRGA